MSSAASVERKLTQWMERELQAKVVHLERTARWRPMWIAAVEMPQGARSLYVRGERPPDLTPTYPLTHERRVHDLFEKYGIPAPHVYGYCEEPSCLVMDRMPGRFNLATAQDERERSAVLADYIGILVRMHSIPLAACASAGIPIPSSARAGAVELFRRVEAQYELERMRPDPLAEFGRRWIHRNVPATAELAMVTYDSGQFLFENGRVTALLDFELAHVTDPHADLAALLLRDTVEPMGDLAPAFRLYEQLAKRKLDPDLIDFHTVAWAMATPLMLHRSMLQPDRETDVMTYLTWYVDNAAWALETMAAMRGIALRTLDEPEPARSTHTAFHAHLIAQLEALRGLTGYEAVRARQALRLARRLLRVDEVGALLEAHNTADVEQLTSIRCGSWEEAQGVLERFVIQASPAEDAVIIPLLHRVVQREHMLLGPPGSRIRRHPPLQRPHRAANA